MGRMMSGSTPGRFGAPTRQSSRVFADPVRFSKPTID